MLLANFGDFAEGKGRKMSHEPRPKLRLEKVTRLDRMKQLVPVDYPPVTPASIARAKRAADEERMEHFKAVWHAAKSRGESVPPHIVALFNLAS